jgi:hypothetical protein
MKDFDWPHLALAALKRAGAIFAIVLLIGCQTLVSKEYPAADWQYQIKKDSVGEKRGVPWGYLFYRGRELKSYFNTVVIKQTRYDFTIKTEESEVGGFWINPEHVTPESQSTEGIGEEEFKRGWYLAGLDQKRTDTPDDWIWIRRENIEAYVDPRKMYSLISKYKISQILEDDDENISPFQIRMGFGFSRRV